MKKESAMKWVEELRNTDRKQGKGRMGDSEFGFCCLGIRAILAGRNFRSDYRTLKPFKKGKSYLGLSTRNGSFDKEKVVWPQSIPKRFRYYDCLTDLNDDGATFKQIADFIELNYPAL